VSLTDYKKVLITGASSGIGDNLVRRLCGKGMEVHALARRGSRLNQLASETDCKVSIVDLRDTDAVYSALSESDYDVLINNAGLGRGFDSLINASRDDIDQTINTNILATVHVTRGVLPGMIARGRGHIVNIGSIAGLYPTQASLYAATKGALHLFSQSLRVELKGSRVRCTEICPARVRTEFFETAIDDPERAAQMSLGFELLKPEDISDAVVFALNAPWRVNISTIEMTPTEQYIGGIYVEPVKQD
jgi:NADP-dependent 3-hydroxy acid dehydrogenase YdfG